MEEQIKLFKKRLRDMGFKRKSERVFYYDNNSMFYVVSFKMEGKETEQIGFEVSHAGMFADGIPKQRCSPVGGWLAPNGVVDDGGRFVKESLPDANFLEKAAKEFFSYFKTANDWDIAFEGIKEKLSWRKFEKIPIADDAGGALVPWMLNHNSLKMKTAWEFKQAIHSSLAKICQEHDFFVHENEYSPIYVHKRGELYDCFFVQMDALGTFFRILAYVWSDKFRLNQDSDEYWGEFFNFGSGEFIPHSSWIRTVDALENEQILDVLFEETIEFCAEFKTAQEWVEYLDAQEMKLQSCIDDLRAMLDGTWRAKGEQIEDEFSLSKRDLSANLPPADLVNSIGMEFMHIPAGSFLMGPNEGEYAFERELPQREIQISRPFFLGKYPVTQAQWEAVMGNNPSCCIGSLRPVTNISWNDIEIFIDKLNAMEGHELYCLPTEAQWEYACRAGSKGLFCFGDEEDVLGEYAWYEANSSGKTHSVGEKKPNAWGLYDMHGNVLEWVYDRDGKYHSRSLVDPEGPKGSKGNFCRILRGGSYMDSAFACCSARRCMALTPEFSFDWTGFRLAMRDKDNPPKKRKAKTKDSISSDE